MDTSALVGHLAAWNYYQSVDTPQNKKFVKAFKAYAKKTNLPGGDKRVTDDPMEAAYFGVYIWKQAVEKAKSFEVDAVRKAVYGQEFLAPGGKIKMDEANHHTYKPVLIGEILKDGQFKVVSRSKGLVKAEPWSHVHEPRQGLRLGEARRARTQKKALSRRIHRLVRGKRRYRAGAHAAARAASPGPGSGAGRRCIGSRRLPQSRRPSPRSHSGDGAVQEAAAVALGKTGDRKILPLLEALREGSVIRPISAGRRKRDRDRRRQGDRGRQDPRAAVHRLRAGADPRARTASRCWWSSRAGGSRDRTQPAAGAPSAHRRLLRQYPARGRGSGPCASRPPRRWATRAIPRRCRRLARRSAKEKDRWVRYAHRAGRRADPAHARGPTRAHGRRGDGAGAICGSADRAGPAARRRRGRAGARRAPAGGGEAVKRVERWALLPRPSRRASRACPLSAPSCC